MSRLLSKVFAFGIVLTLMTGCDQRSETASPPAEPAMPSRTVSTQPAPSVSVKRVVFLGDSLTAGYGLDDVNDAFPARVAERLAAEGVEVAAVNAGVSGDTTAGGLRRLNWVLRQKPDVLVVCLGGNDGLRNTDVSTSKENLRRIITGAQAAGARVLLLGMMIPTNYGPEYREQFASIFPTLGRETGVPVVPFALEGVGGIADLNLRDGIHPNTKGHEIIASNVIGPLREVLQSIPKK